MELSGQNITIIVVALVFAALAFYSMYKGKGPKVTTKFGGGEVGVDFGGAAAAAPDAKPAPALGDIRDNRLLENAKLSGSQRIHVGHHNEPMMIKTVGTSRPPDEKGVADS